MSDFLTKLLQATRFTSVSVKPVFLSRKIGLGYEMKNTPIEKSVLKPVLKRMRAKESVSVKEESSSEDLDRISRILKKKQEKRANKKK